VSQDVIIRALGEPSFYPHCPPRVEHIQTHISHVFLAGPYAYKLKKAVSLPFLDFGSVDLRRHYCAEEVRLNRRLCPEVYLDVLSVTRAPDGGLALGGPGEVIDHVVWMRRLPAERMLANLISSGGVRADMVGRLAATLAVFHAAAPSGPAVAVHADPGALLARWQENMQTAASAVGSLLAAEDHEILADFGPSFIRRHQTLLSARQQAGRIREGHGDLHADNICSARSSVWTNRTSWSIPAAVSPRRARRPCPASGSGGRGGPSALREHGVGGHHGSQGSQDAVARSSSR